MPFACPYRGTFLALEAVSGDRGGENRSADNIGSEPDNTLFSAESIKEAPPGFEPGMEVLQTSALPLGYGAATRSVWLDRSYDHFLQPSQREGPSNLTTRTSGSKATLTLRSRTGPF